MKSQLKLQGIVSARNAKTGEYLFKDFHNTVVFDGCVFTLAKIIGGMDFDTEVFIPSDYDSKLRTETNLSGYKLSKFAPSFNAAFNGDAEVGVQKDDTALTSPQLFDDPQDVCWFDGSEKYTAADIAEEAKDKKIVVDAATGSVFARFKLPVLSPFYNSPTAAEAKYKINPDAIISGSNYCQVNELGLFMAKENSTDSVLFSKIYFPTIMFYGNLAVDFEYRMYI